jgi:hypothetical protein
MGWGGMTLIPLDMLRMGSLLCKTRRRSRGAQCRVFGEIDYETSCYKWAAVPFLARVGLKQRASAQLDRTSEAARATGRRIFAGPAEAYRGGCAPDC